MAGRPALRIGQHGKITRIPLEKGVWIARCRYRDTDGVTRIVERKSPGPDQHGKRAENALLESLEGRRAPGDADINAATKVTVLITNHIERLKEDNKAARTTDTYTYTAGKLAKLIGGLRVADATPPRIDAAVRSMKNAHGVAMARQSHMLMKAGLQLAVMAGVLTTNPVRDVKAPNADDSPVGATAVVTAELQPLLEKIRASEECQRKDLADPIILYAATGLRRSELLGLRWSDYNDKTGVIAVKGKLVRVRGEGLKWVGKAKTKAGIRSINLPPSAMTMLAQRRKHDYRGEQTMIFPSTAGTWRDPDNFNSDWRKVRQQLGLPEVTGHSFRKGVATIVDEAGYSARMAADHLGHAQVSMTQNTYMSRGQSHPQIALAIEEALVGKPRNSDE